MQPPKDADPELSHSNCLFGIIWEAKLVLPVQSWEKNCRCTLLIRWSSRQICKKYTFTAKVWILLFETSERLSNKCSRRHNLGASNDFSICRQCGGAGHTDAGAGLSLDTRRTRGGVTRWESAEADGPRCHHLLTQPTGGRAKVTRSCHGLLGYFFSPPCWCGWGWGRDSHLRVEHIRLAFTITFPRWMHICCHGNRNQYHFHSIL